MVLFYVWVCVMQQSKINSVKKASKPRNMIEMLYSTEKCGPELGVALISSSSSISLFFWKSIEEVGKTAQQRSGASRHERQRRGQKNQGSWQEMYIARRQRLNWARI